METIDVKRFGLAFGTMCALFYLGCVFVMAVVGREISISFFNSILHGIDVTSIIRMNMPVWEMIVGFIEIFILGWFAGAITASVYNLGFRES